MQIKKTTPFASRMSPRFFLCLMLLLCGGCQGPQKRYQKALEGVKLQWSSGHRELAQDSLEILSQQYPQKSELFELLGEWEEVQGHCLEAALYMEHAAQMDLGHPQLLLRCAGLYEAASDWEGALRNYQEYLRRFPKKAQVWRNVAQVQVRVGRPELALQSFYKYFDLTPLGSEQEWVHVLGAFEAAVAEFKSEPQALLQGLREELTTAPVWRLLDVLVAQGRWDTLGGYLVSLHDLELEHPAILDKSAIERTQHALMLHYEAEAFKRKNDCVARAEQKRQIHALKKLAAASSPVKTLKPLFVLRIEEDSELPLYDALAAEPPEAAPTPEESPAVSLAPATAALPPPSAVSEGAPVGSAPTSPKTRTPLSSEDILALKAAAATLQELGHRDQARALYKLALRFVNDEDATWYQMSLALIALDY